MRIFILKLWLHQFVELDRDLNEIAYDYHHFEGVRHFSSRTLIVRRLAQPQLNVPSLINLTLFP